MSTGDLPFVLPCATSHDRNTESHSLSLRSQHLGHPSDTNLCGVLSPTPQLLRFLAGECWGEKSGEKSQFRQIQVSLMHAHIPAPSNRSRSPLVAFGYFKVSGGDLLQGAGLYYCSRSAWNWSPNLSETSSWTQEMLTRYMAVGRMRLKFKT